MPEPTLDEQRELFAAHVAELEEDLRHARERLRQVEREIARQERK